MNYQKEVPVIVSALMDAPEAVREDLVAQLLQACGNENMQDPHNDHYKEFWGAVIFSMVEHLISIKSAEQSSLFMALLLVPKMPLDVHKQKHPLLQRLWEPIDKFDEESFRLFDQMQLLYLMVRLGDFDSASRICEQNEAKIHPSEPFTMLLFGICKAQLLFHEDQGEALARLWIELVLHFYHTDSADTAIFLIIHWIRTMNWQNDSLTKQGLLSKINSTVSKQFSINTAFVLYDIFSLGDRLMPPNKKMKIAELLTRRLSGYLSVRQLQELHFFSGNYSSAIRSGFKESIQYFQFSNYYLNKMWSQQVKTSRFFRSMLSIEDFARSLPQLESRILMLGNQMSMYNNAYVESLQADYDKIESLLKQVEELSLTDALTGLRNRRHLKINLIQMMRLATRHKTPISFAMIDIDHFKKVNDKWGHPAGDKVLVGLADILNEEFRKSDVVIRYGGEEFLLILFDSKLEDTLVKMELLRAKVEASVFRYKDTEIKITISIGVNKHDDGIFDEKDVDRCIEAADDALYIAKNEGRNQVRLA